MTSEKFPEFQDTTIAVGSFPTKQVELKVGQTYRIKIDLMPHLPSWHHNKRFRRFEAVYDGGYDQGVRYNGQVLIFRSPSGIRGNDFVLAAKDITSIREVA